MGCWQSHQLVAAGTISSCCPEPHPRKEHLLESAGAGVSGVQSIAVLMMMMMMMMMLMLMVMVMVMVAVVMMVMIRKLLFGIFPLLMDESLSSGCILTGQVKWNSDVLTNNDFNYHRLYPSYFRLCLTCCSRINQSNPWRVCPK